MRFYKKVFIMVLILLINMFFLDNILAETYNNYSDATVSCGNLLMSNIPEVIPKAISIAYTVIQIAVPVVLVVVGMLDLFKGISAQKEDEIKKGQQVFIKRLVSAALIFFVFTIVKVIISFVADNSSNRILECAECFMKDNCDL